MVNQSLTFILLIEFINMQQLWSLVIFWRDYSTLIKKTREIKIYNQIMKDIDAAKISIINKISTVI